MSSTNEFSRVVTIEPWPEGGIGFEVQADPAELAALARRFELLELTMLRGAGRLDRSPDGREIWLEGWLQAEGVQECVVSLEPVPASIREPIERRFRPVGVIAEQAAQAEDAWIDPDEQEVEPVAGSRIDLGEVLAEHLGLRLDPYPRAREADALVLEHLGPDVALGPPEPPESPFAALRQLQEKRAR
ncbi:MAG: YceD family protein [Geminicoccales bacterium]